MDPITTGSVLAMVNTVREGLRNIRDASGQTSLIDITQAARVEPLLIVDADVMDVEYISDIAGAMHTLFSGYYLQAIEIITNIAGVKVSEKLAPLNPNRAVLNYAGEALSDYKLSTEAYKYCLPTKQNKAAVSFAMESNNSTPPVKPTEENKQPKHAESTMKVDMNKAVSEGASLSAGKLFNITIKENGQTATISIAIRLISAVMPTSNVVHLFSLNNALDNDLINRFHGWRAGRLAFWRDLVLCQDIVDKSRNAQIKDKTGVYNEIVNRQNKNVGLGLLDDKPSMALASNLAIISSETLEQIEYKMLGTMNSSKVRQAIFDNSNLMILAVVDKGYERVTFYHRGIDQPSEMSKSDVKSASKGGGDDVTAVLKAFLAGRTP